jgi:uncharacterized repeat protein (TIGR03803 family)
MKIAILYTAIVALGSLLAGGQTPYKVLWSFAGSQAGDGASPVSSLVLDKAGNLYGTTKTGGAAPACSGSGGCGTVFELSPNHDGSWSKTLLYSFCSNFNSDHCLDGATPQASLAYDAHGNLYGTTTNGGNQYCPFDGFGCGTVFELSPPSVPGGLWTETVLYNFCTSNVGNVCLDGAAPVAQLTRDIHGNLYSTTSTGGNGHKAAGTVFELSDGQAGWTEIVLYNFCSQGQGNFCPDGAQPMAGVTFDPSGNLYGTVEIGGRPNSIGDGGLYRLSPGPKGWTEIVMLAGQRQVGGNPLGMLSLDAVGRIYSTFSSGGPKSDGGVFRLTPGSKPNLFWFSGSNGKEPTAGILIDSRNSTLYGTTYLGGTASGGTVFKIAAGEEAVLYNFCSQQNCTDGVGPAAGVIEDKSGNLYGTAKLGGASNLGVVFQIASQPNKRLMPRPVSVWSRLEKGH